jgi:hypothetical protein
VENGHVQDFDNKKASRGRVAACLMRVRQNIVHPTLFLMPKSKVKPLPEKKKAKLLSKLKELQFAHCSACEASTKFNVDAKAPRIKAPTTAV